MSVYVIIEARINDHDAFDRLVPTAVEKSKELGATMIAHSEPHHLQGEDDTVNRAAILKFDSMEAAHKWHDETKDIHAEMEEVAPMTMIVIDAV